MLFASKQDMTALCFVSREAFPNIRTVDYWLGDNKEERYPQSRTMEAHNKADGWQRRLEVCISSIFNPGAVLITLAWCWFST